MKTDDAIYSISYEISVLEEVKSRLNYICENYPMGEIHKEWVADSQYLIRSAVDTIGKIAVELKNTK